MPPTVAGVASTYVFGTSLTVATPAGAAAGDVLWAWVNAAYNTPVTAAPAGWTLVGSLNQTSGTLGGWFYLYRKDAALASGELTASYTWTIASQNHWGAIVAVRGTPAGAPNAGGASANFSTVVANHSLTIPAITPTVADTLVLAFYSGRSNDTTPRLYTHPSGMTEVLDRADQFSGIGIASMTGPAAGVSTGGQTVSRASGGTAPEWGGVLVALAPSATNTAPTVNAGPDQTGVEPWSTVTLTGTDSDSDGTVASRAWTQTAGSPTVTLSGTGATRTLEAPGTLAGTTLTFSYAVTDDDGATSTDTMTVTVLPATERAVIGGVEVPMQIRST